MELTKEEKQQIISDEMAQWQAQGYRLQVRFKVSEKLEDPKERLDAIRAELERIERALDALREELEAL